MVGSRHLYHMDTFLSRDMLLAATEGLMKIVDKETYWCRQASVTVSDAAAAKIHRRPQPRLISFISKTTTSLQVESVHVLWSTGSMDWMGNGYPLLRCCSYPRQVERMVT